MLKRNLFVGFSFLILLLLTSCENSENITYQSSPEEALQQLNLEKDVLFGESLSQFIEKNEGQYLLVDLREAAEFKAAHRQDAIDMPMPQLLNEENLKLLNSKKHILLSGKDFTQSAGAHILLKRLGYEHVYIISPTDSIIPESAQYDYAAVFKDIQKKHAAAIEAGKPKPIVVEQTPKKTITPKPKPQKKVEEEEEEEGC